MRTASPTSCQVAASGSSHAGQETDEPGVVGALERRVAAAVAGAARSSTASERPQAPESHEGREVGERRVSVGGHARALGQPRRVEPASDRVGSLGRPRRRRRGSAGVARPRRGLAAAERQPVGPLTRAAARPRAAASAARAVELAPAEPVAPARAAHQVPQVRHGGVALLDLDQRQVAAQRREVRRSRTRSGSRSRSADSAVEVAPAAAERHGRGRRCSIAVAAAAPTGRAGPRTRGFDRLEGLDPAGVRGRRARWRPSVRAIRSGYDRANAMRSAAPDDDGAPRSACRDRARRARRASMRRRAGPGARSGRRGHRLGLRRAVAPALRLAGRATGGGPARPASAAAPTKSRNSGCGRLGRLFSSGCAWVATNHGWSRSSMYSTSRSSGETPLNAHPRLGQPLAVRVVDLEPMAVALVGDLGAVRVAHLRALLEACRVQAEAHRAALVGDIGLVGHEVDHRVLGEDVELAAVGVIGPERHRARTRSPRTAAPGTARGTGPRCSRAQRMARILPSTPR